MNELNKRIEIATLGAGCFWCVEAVFSQLRGVDVVKSGYSGGQVKNPTYKEVCRGKTGHAEVCQISFNPQVIPFIKILEVFWKTHNPTTLNKQGNDIGTQYRSVIYFHTADQKTQAEDMKRLLDEEKIWEDPIVTEIAPFDVFYEAEDYHDNYYIRNPDQPYCSFAIAPKLEKFKKAFSEYLS